MFKLTTNDLCLKLGKQGVIHHKPYLNGLGGQRGMCVLVFLDVAQYRFPHPQLMHTHLETGSEGKYNTLETNY